MESILTLILFIILILTSITALKMRNLVAAVSLLIAFSFAAALVYALMGAPDVAFTEAVVGAGVSGVFLISTLFHINRRSRD